jgi:hypothetical protein
MSDSMVSRDGLLEIKAFIDRSFIDARLDAIKRRANGGPNRGAVHVLNWLAAEGQMINEALAAGEDDPDADYILVIGMDVSGHP